MSKKSQQQKETKMTTNHPTAPNPGQSEFGLDPTTVAGQIWAKIERLPFPMFALPGKVLRDYLTPVPIDPSRLFLAYKVGSVIPMLEEVLCTLDQPHGSTPENYVHIKPENRTYKVDTTEKYLIVSLNNKF
jgi:hypothetical protein